MQATLAVATIIPIILGPIVALGIQRNSEKRREKRNRKLVIFKELMATRATTLSPRHVDALNAIEVEFSKGGGKSEKLVLDTWRLYLEHLNTSGTLSGDQLQRWVERKLELLIDLLYEMSRALQYDFDKVALKKNIYSPRGHSELEIDQRLLRQQVIEITAGKRPIWITDKQPPSGETPPIEFIPPGEKWSP